MREVFKPQPGEPGDPGRVFYTITPDDVGKRVITTTIGPVDVGNIIGAVLPIDVGKRLYRVPCKDPSALWFWQCESDSQRDWRLARNPAQAGRDFDKRFEQQVTEAARKVL
jgi:hypothetical protein